MPNWDEIGPLGQPLRWDTPGLSYDALIATIAGTPSAAASRPTSPNAPPPPTATTPNATSAKHRATPTPAWSAAPNTGIASTPSAPPVPAPEATAPANAPPKRRKVSGPGWKPSPPVRADLVFVSMTLFQTYCQTTTPNRYAN